MNYEEIIKFIWMGFFASVILEWARDYLTNSYRQAKETVANLKVAFFHGVAAEFSRLFITIAGLHFFANFAVTSIPISIFSGVICFVLTDLMFYLFHRLEHRCRFFWTFHSVHHSSTDFNLSVGHRLSAFAPLYAWSYMIPFCIAGYDPVWVLFCFQLHILIVGFFHLRNVKRLHSVVEYFFNTPSNHRVHHGANPQYIDKNYAGIFIIWDRIFGTYQEEVEPVNFGLTKNIETTQPIMINLWSARELLRELRSQPISVRRFFVVLFGPP